MGMFSIDGLASGLDTTSILKGLMAIERAPITRMEQRKALFNAKLTAWRDLETKLGALRTAADAVRKPTGFDLFTATSSQASVLTATATADADPGSLTFRVRQLATARQLATNGVASSSTVVGSGTAVLATGLHVDGVSVDDTLATGAHTFEVTAALSGAAVHGRDVAVPVAIGASNNTLDVTVNGVARTVTVAAGTYDSVAALASAVGDALGGDVEVGVEGSALSLRTTQLGSTASLQVTGGSALAALGLAAGASSTGTDGSVTFDGVTTALGPMASGGQVVVTGADGGTMTLTVGDDGLRVGAGTVHVVRTADDTTVEGLAAALRATGADADVRLVNTGSGATPVRLVVSAKNTGVAGALSVGFAGFDEVGTGLTELRSARDAALTMGDGDAALRITRSTNAVDDLATGVRLQLLAARPGEDVTVTVTRDVDGVVGKVKAFVEAFNTLRSAYATHTSYNAETKRAGALQGDSRARQVMAALRDELGNALNAVGVTVQRDGSLAVDETKLRDAMAADFDDVVSTVTGAVDGAYDALKAMLSTDGLVKGATDGVQSRIDALGDRIEVLEDRMELIERRYRRQFEALEKLMSQLRGQGDFLASQIANLAKPED